MQETSEGGEQNVSVAKGFTILTNEKKQGSSKNFRRFNSGGSVNATTRNSRGITIGYYSYYSLH